MQKGTISRLMDKGYGFIAREEEEKDLFFHATALDGVEFNSLKDGDGVTFDIEDGDKGQRAINIKMA